VPKIDLPEVPQNHRHSHKTDDEQEHWKEDESGEGPNWHHLMNLAIQELLQEQGVLKADEVRYMIEKFDGDYPNRGPNVVARAWVDPEFKSRLLIDAGTAITELGIDLEYQARIVALENTTEVHNVVVCTLCSCYPRFLMGQPPTWYKSRSYRARTIFEPREVLREFGTILPESATIKVHDSNADMRYIVIPVRPVGTEGWSESRLAEIITRDHLVGVSLPVV
ncbi:MAG: nitrile hydratase subunit alpha, partial [Desulfobulbia bacterium]